MKAHYLFQRKQNRIFIIGAIILLLISNFIIAQNTEHFYSSGTFEVSETIYNVTVQVWGGGGKGGSWIPPGCGGSGGGGGGGYSEITIETLSPGTYDVVVGQGGNSSNINGGVSYFINAYSVFAYGGSGVSANTNSGGAGAPIGIGDSGHTFSGGNGGGGANGNWAWCSGGGGGSSAGINSNGTSGQSGTGAGSYGGVAPEGGGNGGNAGRVTYFSSSIDNIYPAENGYLPGGGGGGGCRLCGGANGIAAAGNGANGQVIITYDLTLPIDLYKFEVLESSCNSVKLYIQDNLSEYGAAYTIERKIGKGNFTEIGQLLKSTYGSTFIDKLDISSDNIIYYRLKYKTEDGLFHYSKIINTINKCKENKPVIFPNPSSQIITINNSFPIEKIEKIIAIDAMGKTYHLSEYSCGQLILPESTGIYTLIFYMMDGNHISEKVLVGP